MNIVLPIVFFAVVMGLFVRRMTAGHWVGMAIWIMLVIGRAYLKS
jgi:general stress protein CsbA